MNVLTSPSSSGRIRSAVGVEDPHDAHVGRRGNVGTAIRQGAVRARLRLGELCRSSARAGAADRCAQYDSGCGCTNGSAVDLARRGQEESTRRGRGPGRAGCACRGRRQGRSQRHRTRSSWVDGGLRQHSRTVVELLFVHARVVQGEDDLDRRSMTARTASCAAAMGELAGRPVGSTVWRPRTGTSAPAAERQVWSKCDYEPATVGREDTASSAGCPGGGTRRAAGGTITAQRRPARRSRRDSIIRGPSLSPPTLLTPLASARASTSARPSRPADGG